MPYSGRNNIYEATIRRMVRQSLAAQEAEFAGLRAADSDENLLQYLQFCAAALDHTHWPGEIVGGPLIEKRFGTWENALRRANLPAPRTPNRESSFLRVREETERQKEIYRQKKAEKKQKKQEQAVASALPDGSKPPESGTT